MKFFVWLRNSYMPFKHVKSHINLHKPDAVSLTSLSCSPPTCIMCRPALLLSWQYLKAGTMMMLLYRHIPDSRMTKPTSWRIWKSCQARKSVISQMNRVLTLSSTMRVVALSSLVTLIPAKLKKAILTTFPGNEQKKKIQGRELKYMYIAF